MAAGYGSYNLAERNLARWRLGKVRAAGPESAPGWTPADLYPTLDGDFYLPVVGKTYADSTKLVAVASGGDPVGAVVSQLGVGPDFTQASTPIKPQWDASGALYVIDNVENWIEATYARAYALDFSIWAIQKTGTTGVSGLSGEFRGRTSSATSVGMQPGRNACGQVSFNNSLDNYVQTCDLAVYRLVGATRATTPSLVCKRYQGGVEETDATPGAHTNATVTMWIGARALNRNATWAAWGYAERILTLAEFRLIQDWGSRTFGAQVILP